MASAPPSAAPPLPRVQPLVAMASVGPATLGAGAMGTAPRGQHLSMGKILHESFTDGTQLLLLGAMVIGLVTGDVAATQEARDLLGPIETVAVKRAVRRMKRHWKP